MTVMALVSSSLLYPIRPVKSTVFDQLCNVTLTKLALIGVNGHSAVPSENFDSNA